MSRAGSDGGCLFVVLLTSQKRFYAQGRYNLGFFTARKRGKPLVLSRVFRTTVGLPKSKGYERGKWDMCFGPNHRSTIDRKAV